MGVSRPQRDGAVAAARATTTKLPSLLSQRRALFARRFGAVFGDAHHGVEPGHVATAKAAVGNMLGSMAYFYGTSRPVARAVVVVACLLVGPGAYVQRLTVTTTASLVTARFFPCPATWAGHSRARSSA